MKKIFLIASFLTAAQISQAQLYSNNGATIFVNNGAIMQINGGAEFETGSTFTNNGIVSLDGNLVNNEAMMTANAGTIIFNGTASQILSGTAPFFAKNIHIHNTNGVTLNTPLKVDGEFNFINGIVNAASIDNAVTFTANASLSNTNAANDASHINGYVVKEGNGLFTFPVGNGIKYQKVDVTPTANANGIRVKYDTTNAGAGTYSATGTEATPLVSYNALEHWSITPLSTATGNVTIYWDAYKNVAINNTSHLKVARLNGGNWLNEGGIGTGVISAGSVTSNSISSWSVFTLGSVNNLSTLPLQWLRVSGRVNTSGQAVINFKVSESFVARYEIEKSSNGNSFTNIGSIISQGNGENDYNYTHASILQGIAYYRIKQVDVDGKYSYSSVVKLQANNTVNKLTVYPNPVVNVATVSGANAGTILFVTDMNGKMLLQIPVTAATFTIDFSKYSKGVYLLKTSDGSVQKIVKE